MSNAKNDMPILIFELLFLIALSLGVMLYSRNVIGSTTDTTIAILNVTNNPPTIYNVSIKPDPPISLQGTNTTTTLINCTSKIRDPNGWDDITTVNATIYFELSGYDEDNSSADNNYRYFNTSCDCVSISSTNASCYCLFGVWYYANNGSWRCTVKAADAFGLSDTKNSTLFEISPVIGIGTADVLDYGDLSVTETSASKPLKVYNFGNVPINISVRGWGGTEAYSNDYSNVSMICEVGNISMHYERYATNISISYGNMTNLSNTSTLIPDFTLPVRTNDVAYGNDSNVTYWRIYVPSQVSGSCNGTIEITAIQAE